jgi:hypothetical protein
LSSFISIVMPSRFTRFNFQYKDLFLSFTLDKNVAHELTSVSVWLCPFSCFLDRPRLGTCLQEMEDSGAVRGSELEHGGGWDTNCGLIMTLKGELMARGENYEKHLTHTLTLFNNKF